MCACAGSLVDLGFSIEESRHALNVSPGNTTKARSILSAHRVLEERLNDRRGSALAELSNSPSHANGEHQRSEQPAAAEDVKLTDSEKTAISAVVASGNDVRRTLGLQKHDADVGAGDREHVKVDGDADQLEASPVPPALQPGGLWVLAEEHEVSGQP